jgi:hypothetical protein
MAFYMVNVDGLVDEWHINSKKPPYQAKTARGRTVSLLQADGDELEFIISHFKNIPYQHHICVWRGDMAQFIYDNL